MFLLVSFTGKKILTTFCKRYYRRDKSNVEHLFLIPFIPLSTTTQTGMLSSEMPAHDNAEAQLLNSVSRSIF